MMKLLFAILSLCLGVSSYSIPRVIGGHDAPAGKYPYMVSLRIRNIHFCGGSILNKRWVVTAAHCLIKFTNQPIQVVAGTTLLEGGNEQTYESDNIVIHEKYNPLFRVNDIGMIRVNRDIEFNDKVQPIPLPRANDYKDGDAVKLTGWGHTKLRGTASNKLQEIGLKIHDQTQCAKKVRALTFLQESHICTLTKRGEGVCHGDSGGPIVANGVLVGISSVVNPCALGYPDVFTRVYSFLDWISAEQDKL